jgi:hypothetical protein
LCSFGQLYVIIMYGELCFMLSCLVIDQRNYQRSEVCFLLVPMYFWISANRALLVEYNVVNNLVVTREKTWIHDLNDNSVSLYRLEGRSPRAENHHIFYISSSWPKKPDLWPHVLGLEGHNSQFSISIIVLVYQWRLLCVKTPKLLCIPRVALIFACLLVL